MPILRNHRHERFARELAAGKTATDAYALAGYEPNRHNASRLKTNETIQARVEEILSQAALRVEITQARVLEELGKIGFADIRRIVKWHSQANVATVDGDADMQALAGEGEIRFAVANQVELTSSDEIDDDTAAAIAEVSMTDKGTIKVKMHDKRAALVDIGRHLGMFKDKLDITSDGEGFAADEISRATRLAAIFSEIEKRNAAD